MPKIHKALDFIVMFIWRWATRRIFRRYVMITTATALTEAGQRVLERSIEELEAGNITWKEAEARLRILDRMKRRADGLMERAAIG